MNSHFRKPRSRDDWRQFALGLADLQPGALPAVDRHTLDRLQETAWDVANYAAFWRTVQLPWLAPGLLPWVVVLVGVTVALPFGPPMSGPWPSLSSPFVLWPSLWLLGWFALTFGLAAIRHGLAKRRVLRLSADLGLL
jgi:hypothetical protein